MLNHKFILIITTGAFCYFQLCNLCLCSLLPYYHVVTLIFTRHLPELNRSFKANKRKQKLHELVLKQVNLVILKIILNNSLICSSYFYVFKLHSRKTITVKTLIIYLHLHKLQTAEKSKNFQYLFLCCR